MPGRQRKISKEDKMECIVEALQVIRDDESNFGVHVSDLYYLADEYKLPRSWLGQTMNALASAPMFMLSKVRISNKTYYTMI